jgi:hypothetical protein
MQLQTLPRYLLPSFSSLRLTLKPDVKSNSTVYKKCSFISSGWLHSKITATLNVKNSHFIYNLATFFVGIGVELNVQFLELQLEQTFSIGQWLIEYFDSRCHTFLFPYWSKSIYLNLENLVPILRNQKLKCRVIRRYQRGGTVNVNIPSNIQS